MTSSTGKDGIGSETLQPKNTMLGTIVSSVAWFL